MTRAALFLTALLTLDACAGTRIVRDGKVDPPAVQRLESRLATIRGLSLRHHVPIVVVSPAEARVMIEREIRRDHDPADLATLGRAWARLGLLPDGVDLARAYLDFYAAQTAGFYDPVEERIVLVEQAFDDDVLARTIGGILRRTFGGDFVLAHELEHVVQDQRFGLDVGGMDVGVDDAELARRAAYEGDATITGYAVVRGRPSARSVSSLVGDLESMPGRLAKAYPDVPEAIREIAAFQYVAGTNFTSWAYASNAFDGVNVVLANPPRSTEQVLHPEKYFVTPEYPLAINVGALAPYVKNEWNVVSDGTLGELAVRTLFGRTMPAARAAAIAGGWDGDRLVALARDTDLALVWLSAWDSDDDAQEFFAGYAETLGVTAANETVVELSTPSPSYLERKGDRVLVILGPLDPDLPSLAERVWRRSSFTADAPFSPLEMGATD